MANNFTWKFRAAVIRVVDGDTLDMEIDQGMHTRRTERFRLARINCPETHGPNACGDGHVATQYTLRWVTGDVHGKDQRGQFPFIITTTKDPDNWGRYIAEVVDAFGNNLSDDLLASGNAVPYQRK